MSCTVVGGEAAVAEDPNPAAVALGEAGFDDVVELHRRVGAEYIDRVVAGAADPVEPNLIVMTGILHQEGADAYAVAVLGAARAGGAAAHPGRVEVGDETDVGDVVVLDQRVRTVAGDAEVIGAVDPVADEGPCSGSGIRRPRSSRSTPRC